MSPVASPAIRFVAAVPQFTIPDVVRTAEYYRDVLGFSIAGYHGSPAAFGIVQRDRVEVFFNRAECAEPRTGRDTEGYDAYFHIVGVDALAKDLAARGAEILEGPVDRFYYQRELVVRDCNGLVLAFAEDTSRFANDNAQASKDPSQPNCKPDP